MKICSAIHLPGLTLETLGLYFAALGLLKLLSREWPQVRGAWREGSFVIVMGPPDFKALADYVFKTGIEGEWSPYEKLWDAAQKKDTKLAAAGKPVGSIAGWRAEAEAEHSLPLLQSHLVAGETRNSFNPLFGTGGNAGKRLFSGGWQAARSAIQQPKRGVKAPHLRADLEGLLNGTTCAYLGDFGGGCWFSAANKIFNSGFERPFADGQITPWAMLLACEAFPLLAGSASRLLGAYRRQNAAFPFVAQAPQPESDAACGQRLADFWAPVWARPLAIEEVSLLYQSARAELDGKAALTASAFAGAIVQRGIDSGIEEFRCFALQRTTSENTFESQLARTVRVPRQAPAESEFLRRVIACRDALPTDRKQGKRWRFSGLQGPVDRAILDYTEALGECREEPRVEAGVALLDALFISLAKVDRNQTHRSTNVRFERLPLEWLADIVTVCVPGEGVELRLALAVASMKKQEPTGKKADGPSADVQGKTLKDRNRRTPQEFLAYRLGATSWGRYWTITKERSLRAVWSPVSLENNLCALGRRRLMESDPGSAVPFQSWFPAPVADVVSFLEGEVDDMLISRWVDRLSLFDWGTKSGAKRLQQALGPVPLGPHEAVRPLAALHRFFHPLVHDGLCRKLAGELSNPPKPGEKPKLLATAGRFAQVATSLDRDDMPGAWEQARGTLHAIGIPVASFSPELFKADAGDARRLLAALVIPTKRGSIDYFRRHWQLPAQPKSQHTSVAS